MADKQPPLSTTYKPKKITKEDEKLDEKTTNAFKTLGLTGKETEVYIYLLKKGLLKGREVAKGLGMHKSQIYSILKSLQTKGVAKSTIESPTRFEALPIEEAIEYSIKSKLLEASLLEETKHDLIQRLTDVSLNYPHPHAESFMITEGNFKIYARIFQMIQETRTELLLVNSGLSLVKSIQSELDRRIIEKAKSSNIKLRFLTEITLENTQNIESTLKKITHARLEKNLSGRQLNATLGLETCFILRDAQEVLFFLSSGQSAHFNPDHVCLWTNSRAIVNFLQVVFDELWVDGASIAQTIKRLKENTTN